MGCSVSLLGDFGFAIVNFNGGWKPDELRASERQRVPRRDKAYRGAKIRPTE